MCNCSKPISQTDCQRLREFVNDPLKRFFIYHISDEKGLEVAYVPKGVNPNQIALERGYTDENGEAQFYNVREHPCLND